MSAQLNNNEIWISIIQLGLLSIAMLLGNIIRTKLPGIKSMLIPTAVIAGFILMILSSFNIVKIDFKFMESIVYHSIAIGFIALTLRTSTKRELEVTMKKKQDGINSGALIVATYLIQGILGLGITITLSNTICKGLFKASGLLLPLGYGQGPGQANNIGTTYEIGYGFIGGKSFGLAIATMGFVSAFIGGLVYLNYIKAKYKSNVAEGFDGFVEESEFVTEEGEIPLTEAADKFTIQIALVMGIYLLTYLISYSIGWAFTNIDFLQPLNKTIMPLIWGFNFLIGTVLAMIFKAVLAKLRKMKIVKRKYTNNYMLNRISGFSFDYMIVAGIAVIRVEYIKSLWLPLLLLSVLGGIVTFYYVKLLCKVLFPEYKDESMLAMYGMLTGTVSSGILLLREIDPEYKTPAAENLVLGSTTAIVLGFPMLIFIGLAPQSELWLWITVAMLVAYFLILNFYIFKKKV